MSIESVLRVLWARPPRGDRHVSALDVYRTWQAIAEHSDPDGRGTWPAPSMSTLAAETRIARRGVQNAIAALIEQGRIRKVADAVPRVSGTVYDLVFRLDDVPETRTGIPHQLVRGIHTNSGGESPPQDSTNSYGESTPTRTGDSYGRLVRGSPGASLSPIPITPPVVPPAVAEPADVEPVEMTDEDFEAIGSARVRKVLAKVLKPDAMMAHYMGPT